MIQSCADDLTQNCAYASSSSQYLLGSNMSAIGVLVCSRQHDNGEGFVFSKGWTWGYTSSLQLVMGGIVTVPTHIDSLIITYRTTEGGPSRLRVGFEGIMQGNPQMVADVSVPDTSLQELVLTNLPCINLGHDNIGGFLLSLQAYQTETSSTFFLEGVRVVGSPCISTYVHEMVRPSEVRYRYRVMSNGQLF